MPERLTPARSPRQTRGAISALRAIWLSRATAFRRDRSGAAALEFAILAAPFFGFVLLIFQIALYHFSLQSLDYATKLAARQIMTGTVAADARTASGFKTKLLCPNVLFSIDCDSVVINAYRVGKINDEKNKTGIYQFVNEQTKILAAPQSDPKQQSFCLGAPGDYVFLDVAYVYPSFVGSLLSDGENAPDGFLLRSTTFIFNEPFAGAGASTC